MVRVMVLVLVGSAMALSGCGGDGGAAVGSPQSADLVVVPVASPTPSPSVTPTPSPSVTPTPTPTPTPTVTPAPYAYGGGNGTIGTPYLLDTQADVQHIADHLDAYFSLTQDINMAGISFAPLGAFSGTLYGHTHHLYNMHIVGAGTAVAAMFTSVSGTIVQLVLQNVTVTGGGFSAGFAGNLTGLISTCQITGTITSPSGGNGDNTGIGNPVYVTVSGGGTVVTTSQNVQFNGNTVNFSF